MDALSDTIPLPQHKMSSNAQSSKLFSFTLKGQKPEVIPLKWSRRSGCKYEKEAVTSRNSAGNSSTHAFSHNDQVMSFHDIVTDNKGACEIDDRGASNKEQVVMVEKEGHATVVMHPQRHTAQAFLADGTVVTGNNQGEYEVVHNMTESAY